MGHATPLLALALLLAIPARAADLVYSGNLQRVTPESLTVRLADGALVDAKLPTKGDLAAAAIVTRYHLADKVQIRTKENLELRQLRPLGDASPAEREQVIRSISWRGEANLLEHPDPPARSAQDPAGEGLAAFERPRTVNLERAASLPSFIASEKAIRHVSRNGGEWRQADVIESDVTFPDGEPIRENLRIDGKPRKGGIPGMNWSVDFGTELKPVFSLTCPNTFRFEGREESRGRQVLAYGFTAPPDNCFGYSSDGRRRYSPARSGRILVDAQTGYLTQYEESAEYPAGFAVAAIQATTRWDDVQIDGATHLLPVGYEFAVAGAGGERWRVTAEFANHRQFQSSTDIKFQQ